MQSATEAKRPRWARSKRWGKRIALGVVLLALALRLAVPLLLPGALQRLAAERGLSLAYEKLDISILTGSMELWNLQLRNAPKAEGQAGALHTELEFLTADVDISSLFSGDLRIHRAEVDGLDVFVSRASLEAGWSWSGLLGAPSEAAQDEATLGQGEPAEFQGYDLGLPLELRALRLQHLQLHVLDEAQEPAFATRLELNVRLSNLGLADRPARLEVFAHSEEWLDSFSIEGSLAGTSKELKASLECSMHGLRPRVLAAYLEPLGLRPSAERLGLGMHADLHVQARGEASQELSLVASLRDVVLRADDRECLALDALELGVPQWSPSEVRVETSVLRGVRAHLSRTASGALSVGGMQLIARPGPESAQSQAPTSTEIEAQAASSSLPRIAIEALQFFDFGIRFEDEAFTPTSALEWKLLQAELRNIQFDPAQPAQEILLSASMSSAGIFEAMGIQGQLLPFGDSKRCEFDLQVEGIQPGALDPYLAALGLRSDFEAGAFGGQLSGQLLRDDAGGLRADFSIRELKLADENELFALQAFGVKGLRYDPASRSTSIDEVLLDGTRLQLQRDAEGALHFMGLATGAATLAQASQASAANSQTASNAPAPASARNPEPAKRQALPRLVIQRVAWENTSLAFSDASLLPPAALQLNDLGFEMLGLDLGGPELGAAALPASFKLWFKAPELAEQLQCRGSLQSKPGPLDLALVLACEGRGLSYEALRPWLSELGIEPVLQDASLDMQLTAQLRESEQGLEGGLELRDLRFGDADKTYLALGSLELPHFAFGSEARSIEALRLENGELALMRDASGALHAMGLRLLAQTASAAAPEAAGASIESTSPAATPAAASEAGAKLLLGELKLGPLAIHWKDLAVQGGFETTLRLTASSSKLEFGPGAEETSFTAQLDLDGVLESLELNAQARLDPRQLALRGQLAMRGLQGTNLGAYLPPGIELPLQDGRLQLSFEADLGDRPDGAGQSASLGLTDLDYREHGSAQAFLALERLACVVPLLHAEEARYEIDELSLTGLELDLRRGQRGELRLLGLAIMPALEGPVAERAPDPEAAEPVGQLDASMPLPTAQAAPDLSAAIGQAAPAKSAPLVPSIQLNKLDLGIAHLYFLDESEPDAVPLDVELRLTTPGPVTLIAPEADALPPLYLLLSGSALPLLDSLRTRIALTPFQPEPGLGLELALDGIRGAALTEVLPGLAPKLDASALSDGQFEFVLQTHLIARRRSPVDFDLSAGFGIDAELKTFALHDRPEGELLAGIEGISASIKSIRPKTGDVHIERLEIVKPSLHAENTAQGLRVLGLLLKTQPDEELAAASVSTEAQLSELEPAPAESMDAAPDAAPDVARGELRLDEFLISGADFSYADRSVDPAFELPIADFDFELKRFSTRSLESAQPFRFNATLYGAEIQLQKRDVAGNLLGGMLGSLGALVTRSDEKEYEQRPVFDEIGLRGNLSLGPEPKGWAQLRLRALELPALAGLAKQSGVDIGDGLLNESAMLHFDGEGGMRVSSQTQISYLSLSEPPGGPISSYLKLPAPIDTVLFVLRDEEGDLQLPLHLSLGAEGISTASILAAVSQTLGLVIGDAIASSPMKIIGGVIDLAGLGDEPIELDGSESLRLEFATGDVQAPGSMRSQLDPLLALLRRDESLYLVVEHQLSAADLECSSLLANPPAADCLDLAENLRARRTQLLSRRALVASGLSTSYAVGKLGEAQAGRRQLRAVEMELGSIESALDRTLELTRAGAERGAARRARSTALELAQRRLEDVAEYLRAAPIASIGTRVDVRRPRFGVTPELESGSVSVSVRRRQ